MLTGTPALPGGARLMFALEFIFLCGSPAELRGSRRGDPARWPNSTPRLSVAPLGRPINRLNPQIAVSSDAHYLAALFFIHLSEFCSSVLFFFSFLDAQSSDAPQTHFYRSLLFVPASVVLKNRGVSVLVDFACQRIIKETTLFYYCFDFPYGWHCIFHVDTQPCPKEKVTSCYSIDIHFIFSQIRWLILWNYTSRHKTMFVFIFSHLYLKEVKKTFTFSITRCLCYAFFS